MESTATLTTVPKPTKGKKVTTYPTITFDVEDVPELSGKPIDYECLLTIKVRKRSEGKERWSEDPSKPKKQIEVDMLGVEKQKKGKNAYTYRTMKLEKDED